MRQGIAFPMGQATGVKYVKTLADSLRISSVAKRNLIFLGWGKITDKKTPSDRLITVTILKIIE